MNPKTFPKRWKATCKEVFKYIKQAKKLERIIVWIEPAYNCYEISLNFKDARIMYYEYYNTFFFEHNGRNWEGHLPDKYVNKLTYLVQQNNYDKNF